MAQAANTKNNTSRRNAETQGYRQTNESKGETETAMDNDDT